MVAEDRAPEPADEWLASVTMPEAAIPDEHMSGFESFMWDLERDPQLSSAFANLTLFDRAPDRRAFRSRMERAVGAVPRLGQRVVTSALPWELPRWVEDPDVDLDHHLRWVDLGGDGTRRDLYDLVATLSRQPLDRERPLWEFITIEGLQDGRAAMLQRLHHTITDGEGGIILSVEFLDFEREPAHPGRRRSRRSAEGQVADSSSTDTGTGALAADAPTVSGAWWSRAVGSLGSAATSAASQASLKCPPDRRARYALWWLTCADAAAERTEPLTERASRKATWRARVNSVCAARVWSPGMAATSAGRLGV